MSGVEKKVEYDSEFPSFSKWLKNMESLPVEKRAEKIVMLFYKIKLGLAYEHQPQAISEPQKALIGTKSNFDTGYLCWTESRVGIPDNQLGRLTYRNLFLEQLNRTLTDTGVSFKTEDDIHDFLYLLGFRNGGSSDHHQLFLHIFTNPLGYSANPEPLMLEFAKKALQSKEE